MRLPTLLCLAPLIALLLAPIHAEASPACDRELSEERGKNSVCLLASDLAAQTKQCSANPKASVPTKPSANSSPAKPVSWTASSTVLIDKPKQENKNENSNFEIVEGVNLIWTERGIISKSKYFLRNEIYEPDPHD